MTDQATTYFTSKNLPHCVSFSGLFYNDVKCIVESGSTMFGDSLNERPDAQCNCNISKIYPEIMLGGTDASVFVCPFCYVEQAANTIWGYHMTTVFEEEYHPYGYVISAYFHNMEDACLFYMKHADSYSCTIELQLQTINK